MRSFRVFGLRQRPEAKNYDQSLALKIDALYSANRSQIASDDRIQVTTDCRACIMQPRDGIVLLSPPDNGCPTKALPWRKSGYVDKEHVRRITGVLRISEIFSTSDSPSRLFSGPSSS